MKLSFALGLAFLGFACVGGESFAAFLGCYALALAIVSLPVARRALAAIATPAAIGLALLLAAPGAAWLVRSWSAIVEHEGLTGIATYVVDRVRLERSPAIAPSLVAGDRPQRFYVRSEGSQRVRVRFGARARWLAAQSLGEGLFRVDYDPRRDGAPEPANGTLLASLAADDHEVTRELHVSTPLAHPRWLVTSPDRSLAATVSTETDELFVVNSAGLVARLHVNDGPVDCMFVGARELAVSYRDHTQLEVFSLDSGQRTQSLELGARQGRLARSPTGELLAVALLGETPALVIVELATGHVLERVQLTAATDWLVFGADDDTLVYSTRAGAALHRLHHGASGFGEDAALVLGRPAVTLARTAGGRQLVAATTDYAANGKPQLGNHFVQDQLLFIDVAELRVIGRELTARRSERQMKPGDVDRGMSPMGIAEAANAELLVAFAGSDEVWRVHGPASELDAVDLGDTDLHAPHGVAQLADGTLVISSPSYGTLGLLPLGAHEPRTLHLAHDDAWLYAHDRVTLERRVGERGFYEGTRSGISCQSCHTHADSDDAAYNLGEHRLVPTLSVRGLADTAPYLRDGSYPRIRDLDELAETLYRGYLRSQGARGETLEAFVSSLPRREPPAAFSNHELARERRGLAVFVQAGCTGCHAFPAFTNLGKLPMSALFPDEAARLHKKTPEMLDTPSLLSVAASAPYLNDGRAKTLAEVIGKYNAKNQHGDTRALSAEQRADLIAFLRSL